MVPVTLARPLIFSDLHFGHVTVLPDTIGMAVLSLHSQAAATLFHFMVFEDKQLHSVASFLSMA